MCAFNTKDTYAGGDIGSNQIAVALDDLCPCKIITCIYWLILCSQKSDIYRLAFDNAKYGQMYMSDNSYNYNGPVYYNLLLTGTPNGMYRFFQTLKATASTLPHVTRRTP